MRWSRLFTISHNLALCLVLALSFAPRGLAGQVEVEEAENEMLYLPLALKNRIPFIESIGVFDTSFSGDGWATANINGGNETSSAVALQPDGKIVVVGTDMTSYSYDFVIARYTPDGNLDTTFSGDGIVVTDYNGHEDWAYAIAIQPDGKIIVVGSSDSDFALARYNPDGSLDNTFDGDGKVTTNFSTSGDAAFAITLQPDGKILAVGYSYGTTSDIAIARYNENGSLDTSFSFDGKQTTDIAGGDDMGYSIARQADGKIIVAGFGSAPAAMNDFALLRYNANGDLDTTFSGDGIVLTDFLSQTDQGKGVALQPDGKILVVGYSNNGFDNDIALARYNVDGILDITFSGDGKLITDMSAWETGFAVSLQMDGKIIVAGAIDPWDRALVRYEPDGTLDSTFDGDGILVAGIRGGAIDHGQVVALQPDGKIVVVGGSYNYSDDFALERYTIDGILDPSFGDEGTLFSNVTGSDDHGYALALQPDGKILIAGKTWREYHYDFALARHNMDGSLDTTFSGDGRLFTDFSDMYESARAIALQADGKIVVAGNAFSYTSFTQDFVLARYNPDGSLDTTFDGDGMLMTHIGDEDSGYSIAIQPDGKIVVAGYAYLSSRDFSLVRYNLDGSLDTTFDGDGLVTLDFSGRDDYGQGVALQPDGKIVVAGYTYNGTNFDFAIARFNPNGSLDTSFHTTGYTWIDLGGIEYFYSVTIQPDGKILAAGSRYIIMYDDSAVVRFNPDGSLDTGFGVNGMVLGGIGCGYAIALQPYGKIVVAGYAYNYSMDIALLRLNPDGSLDTSFSGDGLLASDLLGDADYGYAVALQPDGRILVAGYVSNGTEYDFVVVRYK